MSVGRESGHVNANDCKDCFGTVRPNAGNSINGVYGISISVLHILLCLGCSRMITGNKSFA